MPAAVVTRSILRGQSGLESVRGGWVTIYTRLIGIFMSRISVLSVVAFPVRHDDVIGSGRHPIDDALISRPAASSPLRPSLPTQMTFVAPFLPVWAY